MPAACGSVERNAVITGFLNGNSPLVWEASMLGAAMSYARAGQPVYYSPFALAGSPLTGTPDLAHMLLMAGR